MGLKCIVQPQLSVPHAKCIANGMINHRFSAVWSTTKQIAQFSCTPHVQDVHTKAEVIHLTAGLLGLGVLFNCHAWLRCRGAVVPTSWKKRRVSFLQTRVSTQYTKVSGNCTRYSHSSISAFDRAIYLVQTVKHTLTFLVFHRLDIEQFRLMNVTEKPLDNRQKYLDVMCFPVLYPSGRFGEHHDRAVRISSSEYVKSRLLGSDSRFRKDPQFVFYNLWQRLT